MFSGAALQPPCAAAAVLAQTAPTPAPGLATAAVELERVIINADPLRRDELDALQPVNVVRGDALRAKEGTNLGATLSRELGVQSSAYGAGAGRPIIRGMDSARVRVAEGGLGVADASGASPDHRVAADTRTVRRSKSCAARPRCCMARAPSADWSTS